MAYSTISKPSLHFNTKLWTGNSTDNTAITGVGFQPDFLWIKNRTDTNSHALVNSTTGATEYLESNTGDAEASHANMVKSFDTDGFTLGNIGRVNASSNTYVGWNWKANGGTTSSNTDGSITSTVQANTTSGFSIVTFTGTGANATVGHGLGVAPKLIIVKRRPGTQSTRVGINDLGWGNLLYLDSTSASSAVASSFQSTAPTSSVFSVGTDTGVNGSGDSSLAYCFAEKTGYSKFGSFTVNSNSTNFVYTGFRPKFLIMKQYSSTAGNCNWGIFDDKRDGYNSKSNFLYANTEASEDSSNAQTLDFLSNGFKLRGEYVSARPGESNIFMAFGQSLVGSNNVPCTAR